MHLRLTVDVIYEEAADSLTPGEVLETREGDLRSRLRDICARAHGEGQYTGDLSDVYVESATDRVERVID